MCRASLDFGSNGGVQGLSNNPDGCSPQRSRVPAAFLSCRKVPTFVSDFCHHCPLREQLKDFSQSTNIDLEVVFLFWGFFSQLSDGLIDSFWLPAWHGRRDINGPW